MACQIHSFRLVRPDGQARHVAVWMFHPGYPDEHYVASVWPETADGHRDESGERAQSYSTARTKEQAEWRARQEVSRQWAVDAASGEESA